jgi:hypothetical protein
MDPLSYTDEAEIATSSVPIGQDDYVFPLSDLRALGWLRLECRYRRKCYWKRDSSLENRWPKQPQQNWLGIIQITELGYYSGSVRNS